MSNLILPDGWDRDDHEKDEERVGRFKEIAEKDQTKDMRIFGIQRRLSELDDFLEGFGNEEDDPTGKVADEIKDCIVEEIKILQEDLKKLREDK
jgi:hypothetical protein